jgi:hypothetical protein
VQCLSIPIFRFSAILAKKRLDKSISSLRVEHFIISPQQRKNGYIPERHISKSQWNEYGDGYLLMPDPRGVPYDVETIWGNDDGIGGAIDAYGRKLGQKDYNKEVILGRSLKLSFVFKRSLHGYTVHTAEADPFNMHNLIQKKIQMNSTNII